MFGLGWGGSLLSVAGCVWLGWVVNVSKGGDDVACWDWDGKGDLGERYREREKQGGTLVRSSVIDCLAQVFEIGLGYVGSESGGKSPIANLLLRYQCGIRRSEYNVEY